MERWDGLCEQNYARRSSRWACRPRGIGHVRQGGVRERHPGLLLDAFFSLLDGHVAADHGPVVVNLAEHRTDEAARCSRVSALLIPCRSSETVTHAMSDPLGTLAAMD